MKWDIHVAGPARKSLKRIPDGDRKKILAVLEAMRQAAFSGDIARLNGIPIGNERSRQWFRLSFANSAFQIFNLFP